MTSVDWTGWSWVQFLVAFGFSLVVNVLLAPRVRRRRRMRP